MRVVTEDVRVWFGVPMEAVQLILDLLHAEDIICPTRTLSEHSSRHQRLGIGIINL